VVKVGLGQRHKGQQHQMGAEEKWLRVHQAHLLELREPWDVILYGDDIVEAWRLPFSPSVKTASACELLSVSVPFMVHASAALLCSL
jgi:hypothetical protein